jgi:chondroitin 4-sulfotransferase 11
MISHSHKFIFIPVRRAAGTSLSLALGEGEDLFNRGVLSDGFYRDIEKYRDYFVFTVVRNPWDRIISGYFYSGKGIRFLGRRCSFEEFLENLPNRESNYKWWFHLTRTLTEMLIDRDGKFIADFVIRFENLRKDFKHVCDKLGLRVKLPHLRATGHKHYSKYYTEKTFSTVAERFRSDIEYFGYKFEDH